MQIMAAETATAIYDAHRCSCRVLSVCTVQCILW